MGNHKLTLVHKIKGEFILNKFVYEDELDFSGNGETYDVCYPIETEMSLDELVAFIREKARKFKDENPDEDIFYPFGGNHYQMSAMTFLAEVGGYGYGRHLTPIEKWEGVKI